MILSLLSAITVTFSSAGRCPCTVLPGRDSLSRATIIQQARSDAYAVILGRVVRVDTLAWDSLFLASGRRPIVEPRLVRYWLDSVTSWKGPRQDQIHVFVQRPYMSCGRSLGLNQEYVLFTYRSSLPSGQGVEIGMARTPVNDPPERSRTLCGVRTRPPACPLRLDTSRRSTGIR